MSVLYAEDLPVGRLFELGEHTVSAEEIKEFATAWDPLPFHIDESAAAAGPFGGLIASGAHALAICVRLVSDAAVSQMSVIAGRGILEARFLRPIRPDMRLTGTTTIEDQQLNGAQPGVIVISSTLSDVDGKPVLKLVGELLVRRRPAEN